ncbi:hypothetical protein THAOC_17258 [Thalassiosira oceanica]|uniref:Uncharacterized protein n=1 Tax=Thalassiosira oceanica TaxID=159749 RepID=K0S7S2_THAOC|nr:hypothetical protein THAOC_17258 [Thalassiosira oceanica]|eukprot:EJK62143.1 hypothetical protein THAOC_17258 [Thalassiosira oceanica]
MSASIVTVRESPIQYASLDLSQYFTRLISILYGLTPFQAEENSPAETHEIGVQAEPQPACEPTRVGES